LTRGRLTVVGCGICAPLHVSVEAAAAIAHAQDVFCLAADPLVPTWLATLHANVVSVHDLYAIGVGRETTYEAIVERVLGPVRRGRAVCFVLYGHPGIFAFPGHEALRRARAEGHEAAMLPAISAEDCLFADLGVDPSAHGIRSFEATDFLLRPRLPDPSSALLLWQIGLIAERSVQARASAWNPAGIALLTDVLLCAYPDDHEVVVYEASPFAICGPRIARIPLAALPLAPIGPASLLYVPAYETAAIDPIMARALGLEARARSPRSASTTAPSRQSAASRAFAAAPKRATS
jgi:uncharacterized protein YabN with tetrapyrrole methylase and pyrophosphatase domain